MSYRISDECIMCGACAAECPVSCISAGRSLMSGTWFAKNSVTSLFFTTNSPLFCNIYLCQHT